jgi:UDP-N-acetylglucosamine 2-epimerase (non-hydrolysing)
MNRKRKKILLVFGTRPEAIKIAPLIKEFQKYPDVFETVVCVTGQHRELLDQVLQLFEIKPDYDLNIMKAGQDLYDVTSKVLMGMRDVLNDTKPDLILVHGDTSTSTAAALAAFYQKIPVGHVEAGLRTNNIYSPWPEEVNRQLTGRLCSYHFAPTKFSKQNLIKENIPEQNIYVTGNTVIDALHMVLEKLRTNLSLEASILQQYSDFGIPGENISAWKSNVSKTIVQSSNSRKLVLITGHRRENFGQGFINICDAIKELAKKSKDVDFVYPMHLNPNVRNAIKSVFEINDQESNYLSHGLQNVFFIEPLDYLPFVYLMNLSHIVLTDSGGIQEEAPGLGKPVLVMRDTTERPEAMDAGTVRLVGTNTDKIIEEVSLLINSENHYNTMSKATNPYGDGKACDRIVEVLK